MVTAHTTTIAALDEQKEAVAQAEGGLQAQHDAVKK